MKLLFFIFITDLDNENLITNQQNENLQDSSFQFNYSEMDSGWELPQTENNLGNDDDTLRERNRNSSVTDSDDSEDDYYSIDGDDFDENDYESADGDSIGELPGERDFVADAHINVQPESAADALRKWALESQTPHVHLDVLLKLLHFFYDSTLPLCSKTFLNISKVTFNIRKFIDSQGKPFEFIYLSISEGLKFCVNPKNHPDKRIRLQTNIDGLPLYKSSAKNFWLILNKVFHDPDIYEPFPVAIYSGDGKPDDLNIFLDEFIAEINYLLEHGIVIDNQHFEVELQCFICDTPARALLKKSKGHGGYFACERCSTRGEPVKVKKGEKIVFPNLSAPRTDESFRRKMQKGHHIGTTPLLNIRPKIDMIFHFVLDWMHLICLRVMKKLLNQWLHGPPEMRLGPTGKRILSARMESLSNQIPLEFNRKPRSTNIFARWKATEFRLFVLYIGPVVLKGIILDRFYKHFLLLHVACRILCSSDTAIRLNNTARFLLTRFFANVTLLYGKTICTYNMHNIPHFSEDVLKMGCNLNLISDFSFENYLGKIKRLLRNGYRPLAQICRRLYEYRSLKKSKPVVPPKIQVLKTKPRDRTQILRIKYFGSTLTTTRPNNTVLLDDNQCFLIEEIRCDAENLEETKLIGRIWKQK